MNIDQILKQRNVITSFWLKNQLFKHKLKPKSCENCKTKDWLGQELKFELHHIDGNNTNNQIENLQILCPNCHSQSPNFRGRGKTPAKNRPTISEEEIIKIIPECYCRREVLLKVGLVGKGGNYVRINRILKENPNICFKQGENNQKHIDRLKMIQKLRDYQETPKQTKTKPEFYHEGSLSCGPTKIKWMSNEELSELVWEIPMSKLAKELGVSDSAIKHRCKHRKILTPPIGYWRKLATGQIKECLEIKQKTLQRTSTL